MVEVLPVIAKVMVREENLMEISLIPGAQGSLSLTEKKVLTSQMGVPVAIHRPPKAYRRGCEIKKTNRHSIKKEEMKDHHFAEMIQVDLHFARKVMLIVRVSGKVTVINHAFQNQAEDH